MHLRLHRNQFEIWEGGSGYRRTHAWRAKGRNIPDSILDQIPESARQQVLEKVDHILRGGYTEPLPTRDLDKTVERYLEETTEMCSRIRWGKIPPNALVTLLIANVRLREALALNGLSKPRRRRAGSPATRMAG